MLDVTFYKVMHGGRTEAETLAQARKIMPYIKNSDIFSLEMTAHSQEEVHQIARSWAGVLQDPNANRTNVRQMMVDNMRNNRTRKDYVDLYLLTLTDYLFRSRVGLWLAERFSTREEGMKLNSDLIKIDLETRRLISKVRDRVPKSERDFYEVYKTRYGFTDERDQLVARLALDSEDFLREVHPWLARKEVISYGIPLGSFHEPERYLPGAKVVSLVEDLPEHIRLCSELKNHIKTNTPFEELGGLIRSVADTAY